MLDYVLNLPIMLFSLCVCVCVYIMFTHFEIPLACLFNYVL